MQIKINLTDSALCVLPQRTPRMPRERFIKYYQDLYGRLGYCLPASAFLNGSHYAYTDLAIAVLDHFFKTKQTAQTDILFIVTWSPECDPDQVSCAAYLQHRYHFTGKLFDVGDQGILSLFTTFVLAQKYLQNSAAQRALILVLEQTTVPQHTQSYRQPPSRDFACLLQLEKQILPDKYGIAAAGIFEQPPIYAELLDRLQMAGLSAAACANTQWICHAPHGAASRSLPAAFRRAPGLFPGQLPPCLLPYDTGQFSQLHWLHSVIQAGKGKTSKNQCLLIEDRETPAIGYLLLN
jgi:hypothetical protein